MKNLPIEINYILKSFDVHLCGGAVVRFILGRDTGTDYDYDIVALDRPTMMEVAKILLRDFEYVTVGDPGLEYQSDFSVERMVFRRGDTVVDLLGVSFDPRAKVGEVTLADWLASVDIDAAQVAWDRKARTIVMTPEAALAYGRGEPRVVAANTRKTTPGRLDKYKMLFVMSRVDTERGK